MISRLSRNLIASVLRDTIRNSGLREARLLACYSHSASSDSQNNSSAEVSDRIAPGRPMLCRISDRKLFKLTGVDLSSILKGLTTSNATNLSADPDLNIQHTLFLNTKGRIITDSFLVKPVYLTSNKLATSPGELWLEAYSEHSQELTEHIKKHAFRKQIKIEDISDMIDTLCLFVISS